MKLIYIAILFVFSSVTLVYSQSWSHTQSFGDDWFDEFEGFAIDSHGNTYVSGTYRGDFYYGDTTFQPVFGEGGQFSQRNNKYIIKADSAGDVQWIKTMGQDTFPVNTSSNLNVLVDDDDDVYVNQRFDAIKPYFFEGQEYPANDTSDVYRFSKFDPNGNVVWSKEIIAFVIDDFLFFNGRLNLLGVLNGYKDFGDTVFYSDVSRSYIASLNVDDGKLEDFYLFPDGIDIESIRKNGDELIALGNTSGQSDILDSLGITSILPIPVLWGLSESLEITFFRHYQNEFPGGVHGVSSIAVSPLDSIITITGFYDFFPDTLIYFGDDTVSTSLGDNSGFIAATDLEGNPLWLRAFYGEDQSRFSEVKINKDGYIYAAGDISYQSVFMDTVFDLGPDYEGDLIWSKFTKDGDLVWAESPGNTDEDNFVSLHVLGDQVYVAGESGSSARVLLDLTDATPTFIPRILDVKHELAYFMRIEDCNTRIEPDAEGLHIPEGEEYAWYKNDQLVQSGLSADYVPVSAGNYWAWVTYANGCKVRTHKVWADVLTNLNTSIATSRFSIYPNPIDSKLQVAGDMTGGTDVLVTDIIGNKMLEQHLFSKEEALNVTSLHPGAYLIQLTSGDVVETKSFVKQ